MNDNSQIDNIGWSNKNNFLLYKTGNEKVKLNVLLHNESIWLTQKLK